MYHAVNDTKNKHAGHQMLFARETASQYLTPEPTVWKDPTVVCSVMHQLSDTGKQSGIS